MHPCCQRQLYLYPGGLRPRTHLQEYPTLAICSILLIASIGSQPWVSPSAEILSVPKQFREDQSNHGSSNLVPQRECVFSSKFAASTFPTKKLRVDSPGGCPTPPMCTLCAANVDTVGTTLTTDSDHCPCARHLAVAAPCHDCDSDIGRALSMAVSVHSSWQL